MLRIAAFSTVLSGFGTTPPEQRVRAFVTRLLGASAMKLAVLSGLALIVGIGISIATTTDPTWWMLHFSQLGTFRDASAAFFNGALIVGGSIVVLFARAAERELRPLEGTRIRRGTARTARVFFSTVGVNLALVGYIPLNTISFIHDQVAAGMVLGFAGLLFTTPFMMHRVPKRLLAATLAVFAYLFVGTWLFVTGDINLALFEVIAFSAMFSWSGAFLSALAKCAVAPVAVTSAPLVSVSFAASVAPASSVAVIAMTPVVQATPVVSFAAPVASSSPVSAPVFAADASSAASRTVLTAVASTSAARVTTAAASGLSEVRIMPGMHVRTAIRTSASHVMSPTTPLSPLVSLAPETRTHGRSLVPPTGETSPVGVLALPSCADPDARRMPRPLHARSRVRTSPTAVRRPRSIRSARPRTVAAA